jgi:tight adherence protein B
MEILLYLIIVAILIYLIFDYIENSRREKIIDRITSGLESYSQDDSTESMWSGAMDLVQLEAVRNLVYSSAISRGFDLAIRRAGFKIGLLQAIFLVVVISSVSSAIAYVYFKNVSAALVALLVFPLFVWLIVSHFAEKRQLLMDKQLPALINSLINTMRVGGTPVQGLMASAENAPNPLKDSMSDVLNHIQLGRPPVLAWKEWSDFWDTKDTKLLSSGIRLKWDSGGQMTSVLEHIYETLEFRRRMQLKVSTLTAQAKLSSWILSALPFLLGIITYVYRPDLFDVMLNDKRGTSILIYVVVSTIIGFLWLRHIAKLRS